jgi:hypothetical protein
MACGSCAHPARPLKITATLDLAKPFLMDFDQHIDVFSRNSNLHFRVIASLVQRTCRPVTNKTFPTPPNRLAAAQCGA